jgi:hypothetical protein
MSVYHHKPLEQPGNCIRLLQLLPGSEDPIYLRCKLFECDLHASDGGSRPYEALSYVWGSEEKTQSIIIVGHGENEQNDQELRVTSSLYEALLELQDQDIPRIIWADGVCIDQSNIREKEFQIPLMAEIYARASRVIVWLGQAGDDSDKTIEAICAAAGHSDSPYTTESSAQAIGALLARPWFGRIWVWT